MKKRRLYMVELEKAHPDAEIEKNHDFLVCFQTAVLLSLLKSKKLTQWQFDCCVKELKKVQDLHAGRTK